MLSRQIPNTRVYVRTFCIELKTSAVILHMNWNFTKQKRIHVRPMNLNAMFHIAVASMIRHDVHHRKDSKEREKASIDD